MKKGYALFPILAMLALILDSRTASAAASEGVELVLRTAVPALFPFFILSAMLVPYSSLLSVPALSRVLGVPPGWEAVFLLGCIGGYPVGAQCVAQGYSSGQLSRQDAERMLGFCTNCGPSFLFGIVAASFSTLTAPIAIFLIGIFSAILTAAFWPGHPVHTGSKPVISPVSLPQAVQIGLKSMASVSAWIILGKILLRFLDKYLLYYFPVPFRLILTGMLELTNGCLLLSQFPAGVRFFATCCFTTFGGLCVWMQVKSLCAKAGLDAKHYLPQKLTQSAVALCLAGLYSAFGFAAVFACAGTALLSKKTVEISKTMVYNRLS